MDILEIALFEISEKMAYNYSIVYFTYSFFVIHFLISILAYIWILRYLGIKNNPKKTGTWEY